MAQLKASRDSFDRRFESRELEIVEGPEDRDGAVWMRWRARYRVSDAPPLDMEGEETVTFDGDRIRRLEDRFPPDAPKAMLAWLSEHGSKMKQR